jgi:hypothetical protein
MQAATWPVAAPAANWKILPVATLGNLGWSKLGGGAGSRLANNCQILTVVTMGDLESDAGQKSDLSDFPTRSSAVAGTKSKIRLV